MHKQFGQRRKQRLNTMYKRTKLSGGCSPHQSNVRLGLNLTLLQQWGASRCTITRHDSDRVNAPSLASCTTLSDNWATTPIIGMAPWTTCASVTIVLPNAKLGTSPTDSPALLPTFLAATTVAGCSTPVFITNGYMPVAARSWGTHGLGYGRPLVVVWKFGDHIF